MPTEEELRAYYAGLYTESHDQLQIQQSNRDYYATHVKELLSWYGGQKDPSLVDFGSSYPVMASEALRGGFGRAISVDFSTEAAQFASAEGVELMTPDEFFENVAPNSIDVLRCSHVLEHVIDPVGLLVRLAGKLKSGGLVYVTQPSVPVMVPELSEVDVQDSDYPNHLHFFSPISLLQMMSAVGIRPERFFTHTEETLQLERHRSQLDMAFTRERLQWAQAIGEPFFGELANYPIYSGRNCLFRGTRA